MSPLIIVAIIVLCLLLAGLLLLALTKSSGSDASDESAPKHDHSAGEANCPACQASAKPVKVKIPLKCMVQFRPKSSWKGEFGFDWMRIGDTGEKAYKDVIAGGYKGKDGTGKVQEYNGADAYKELKKEYASIATTIKSEPEKLEEYFVPYINLYPQKTAGVPTPPFEAELRIMVTVKDIEPEKIEYEYNSKVFTLDKQTLGDKAIGSGEKREASETLKITCDNKFDKQEEINVWAYPKGAKSKTDATLAGKLIFPPNSEANRKEAKFVLIKVKTKLRNAENTGSFTAVEKQNLSNVLYQAMISGLLEDGPDLDLTNDPHLKIITGKIGKVTRGKFLDPVKDVIFEDHKDGFFAYVKKVFLAVKGNDKYKNYFTVFCFGEGTYDGAFGQVEDVKVKNLVLFNVRKDTTFAHEALHGLGLQHAHRDNVPEPERKFFFTNGETDNIVSYAGDRKSTWHWQWEIMKKNV